jgi:hypothetical protein
MFRVYFFPVENFYGEPKFYNYAAQYARSFLNHEYGFGPQTSSPTDAIGMWVQNCYVSAEKAREASATSQKPFELLTLIAGQNQIAITQIDEARNALHDLRSRSIIFATVAAVVGFLTTIVAAMNAWTTTDGRIGSSLKIFGVVLPALGTLVAALFSIYAPVDTATRKAQLLSSLIGLQGDLQATLSASTCNDVLANKAELGASIADWNKRFSAAVAAAEISQAAVPGAKDGENKPADGNPKDSQAK